MAPDIALVFATARLSGRSWKAHPGRPRGVACTAVKRLGRTVHRPDLPSETKSASALLSSNPWSLHSNLRNHEHQKTAGNDITVNLQQGPSHRQRSVKSEIMTVTPDLVFSRPIGKTRRHAFDRFERTTTKRTASK